MNILCFCNPTISAAKWAKNSWTLISLAARRAVTASRSLARITHKFSVHIDRASICSVSSLSLYLSKNIRVNVDIGNCNMCFLCSAVSKFWQANLWMASALSAMNESTRLKHLRSRGRKAAGCNLDMLQSINSQSSNSSLCSGSNVESLRYQKFWAAFHSLTWLARLLLSSASKVCLSNCTSSEL